MRDEGQRPRKFHQGLTEQACAALGAQLEGAPRAAVPSAVAHLVDWFWELDNSRQGNGSGPNPLAWSDIEAWTRLMGITPEPWELRALQQMDHVQLRRILDQIAGRRKRQKPGQAPEAETLPKLQPGMLRLIASRDVETKGGAIE